MDREPTTRPGIYVDFAKKSSDLPFVSRDEAVDVALCFGWIDGRANAFDDQHHICRFAPQRKKSTWSQKNVETIGRLLERGKIRPAGIVAVEAAKGNGRWRRAYAGSATIEVPDDLRAFLLKEPAAQRSFDSLSKTDVYLLLLKVLNGSPAT
jgi:uncharacterized protein YdeI (YjbR/CyaY-like superfamily)